MKRDKTIPASFLAALVLAVCISGPVSLAAGPEPSTPYQDLRPPAPVTGPTSAKGAAIPSLPVTVSPQPDRADLWRRIRQGDAGRTPVSGLDKALLLRPGALPWRNAVAIGEKRFGVWLFLLAGASILGVFVVRGRIRVQGRAADRRVDRFGFWHRFAHWTLAISFLLLAATGLLITYGTFVIRPLFGADAFGSLALYGTIAHSALAPVFVVGIVMTAALWLPRCLPAFGNLAWVRRLFRRGDEEPPWMRRYNGLQKVAAWGFVTGGLGLAVTGGALLFPDWIGHAQELQRIQTAHSLLAMVLVAAAVAHIYVATVGVEGAFEGMWRGVVSEAWAWQHHREWITGLQKQAARTSKATKVPGRTPPQRARQATPSQQKLAAAGPGKAPRQASGKGKPASAPRGGKT